VRKALSSIGNCGDCINPVKNEAQAAIAAIQLTGHCDNNMAKLTICRRNRPEKTLAWPF